MRMKKLKVWYIIKGNGIKSCIEDEDGYYVLEDIWVFKGRINKRPKIKQVLKEPHVIDFSHRTSHIPFDPPLHFVLVDYPALRGALMKFKRGLEELGNNLIKDLDDL
jgi:hypothetical protein